MLIASFASGLSLVFLCMISFRQRNSYFERRFGAFLTVFLLIALIPPFTVLFLLENAAAPGLRKWEESIRNQWEKTKYVDTIDLKWDATKVTGEPFLKDLGKTLENRLHPAKRQSHGRLIPADEHKIDPGTDINMTGGLVDSISGDLDKNGKGPVTSIHLTPHAVKPNSSELSGILKSVYPKAPKDLSTGLTTDSLSIRSIHPGQERLASSGYPPAPTGYIQLPWKDGFVYVSGNIHIDESHITHAERYNEDGIMATVSPEGQIKMMTMARKLSQLEVAVAILLNDSVRGIYTPTPSITDQFFIPSIPLSQDRIDAIANSLSMPNKWGPGISTEIHYNQPTPNPDDITTQWWTFVKNYGIPRSVHLCLAVFLIMIFACIAGMGFIHSKTKNKNS